MSLLVLERVYMSLFYKIYDGCSSVSFCAGAGRVGWGGGGVWRLRETRSRG